MKTITLFFALFFLFFNSTAQNPEEENDDFFFRTEVDSLGDCYGKSLIETKWDTITEQKIYPEICTRIVPSIEFIIDTIKTNNYFINPKDKKKLILLLNYCDTINSVIEISEERRRLEKTDCPTELISEKFLIKPSFLKWEYTGNNKCSSRNWNMITIPQKYETRHRKVLKYICDPREVVIPAQYLSVVFIIPKKNIKSWQIKNIKLICQNYYLKENSVLKYKEEIYKPEYNTEKKIILKTLAHIGSKKIICNTTQNIISKIQKQLFALGLYSGNFLGELNNKTKEAIIRYQMKYHLPIGQLDEETVKHILNKKTAFNP